MGRPVVHFEIGCRDSAKTADFYNRLFGWHTQAMGPRDHDRHWRRQWHSRSHLFAGA